ncbi:hypothetical protein B7494_g2697 [Chlorociboria aeruginascens]|nr:hypothetical protein B7494_g2697 [Chlorociboria aeruginascens]
MKGTKEGHGVDLPDREEMVTDPICDFKEGSCKALPAVEHASVADLVYDEENWSIIKMRCLTTGHRCNFSRQNSNISTSIGRKLHLPASPYSLQNISKDSTTYIDFRRDTILIKPDYFHVAPLHPIRAELDISLFQNVAQYNSIRSRQPITLNHENPLFIAEGLLFTAEGGVVHYKTSDVFFGPREKTHLLHITKDSNGMKSSRCNHTLFERYLDTTRCVNEVLAETPEYWKDFQFRVFICGLQGAMIFLAIRQA